MPRKTRPAPLAEAPATPPPASKTDLVLELMRRSEGATLDELTSATGWQPHSARAALTGMRKKGHEIVHGRLGDVTCYRITAKA